MPKDTETPPRKRARVSTREESPEQQVATHFELIRDAVTANPNGLRLDEIMAWLEENRYIDIKTRDRKRLKASIRWTLGLQVSMPNPKIRRLKSPSADWIYTLAPPNTVAEARRTKDINDASILSCSAGNVQEGGKHDTYMGLIKDALAANPYGMQSPDVIDWLRENRSGSGEGRTGAGIQACLGSQCNRAVPTVRRWRDAGSEWIYALVNDTGAETELPSTRSISSLELEMGLQKKANDALALALTAAHNGSKVDQTMEALDHQTASRGATVDNGDVLDLQVQNPRSGVQPQFMVQSEQQIIPATIMVASTTGDTPVGLPMATNEQASGSDADEAPGIMGHSSDAHENSGSDDKFQIYVTKIHKIRDDRNKAEQELLNRIRSQKHNLARVDRLDDLAIKLEKDTKQPEEEAQRASGIADSAHERTDAIMLSARVETEVILTAARDRADAIFLVAQQKANEIVNTARENADSARVQADIARDNAKSARKEVDEMRVEINCGKLLITLANEELDRLAREEREARGRLMDVDAVT